MGQQSKTREVRKESQVSFFYRNWYMQVFLGEKKRKEEVRLCWLIATSLGKSKFYFDRKSRHHNLVHGV
jgi:hypothetical protein